MPTLSIWRQQLSEHIGALNKLDSFGRLSYLGDNPLENFAYTEQVINWDEFLLWLNGLEGSWCFRGQRESSWSLETSLDRSVRVEHSRGYFHLDRETEQQELLFRFQQEAHNHIHPLPSTDDIASWYALMQHYGAPTRLLDWTKSPYVSLYFAFVDEPQNQEEPCSAIWAINLDWLARKETELLETETQASTLNNFKTRAIYMDTLLIHADERKPLIVQIDPQRISQRMVAQQGLFLCKLVHEVYFDHLLVHMMLNSDVSDQPVLKKLTLEKTLRIGFLKRLREMNIHSASLYPGLDGFGKSLMLDLEIKAKSSRP
jgi:hypothetical protein